MAVVNCTGDSFYAPSRALLDEAVDRALAAEAEGAAIIDFGGESTRPGSQYVSAEDELARLIPVITVFRKRSALAVSVDTRKAAVAQAVLDAGADIINDISALEDDPRLAELCASRRAAVVLMHKKGVPLTMQQDPCYEDVTAEVAAYLAEAAQRAEAAGIEPDKIIVDPGIGFGKRHEDNLELIRQMERFTRLAENRRKHYPVLVGLSRKGFIGEITGRRIEERLAGTIAANAAAIIGGAAIIRVHDVKEHIDLVKMLFALRLPQTGGQ